MIEQAIIQLLPHILSLDINQKRQFVEHICYLQCEIFLRFAQKNKIDIDEYGRLYNLLGEVHNENIEESLKRIAPDMDNFAGDLEATAALDACAILNQAFLFFENENPKHLGNILEHFLNVYEIEATEKNEHRIFERAFLVLRGLVF